MVQVTGSNLDVGRDVTLVDQPLAHGHDVSHLCLSFTKNARDVFPRLLGLPDDGVRKISLRPEPGSPGHDDLFITRRDDHRVGVVTDLRCNAGVDRRDSHRFLPGLLCDLESHTV
jgi:hypothetical protein